MVKLIVTDVDDTLVPEAGSVINPEYYDIIRECRKRGIIFGVASGRQKPCVRKLFEPVLDEIFILADNGTDIWSSQYQTSMKLPYDLYTELIDDIHELEGYSIMACKPDIAYFEYGHEKYFEHMKTYPYVGEYTDDMRGIRYLYGERKELIRLWNGACRKNGQTSWKYVWRESVFWTLWQKDVTKEKLCLLCRGIMVLAEKIQ